MTRYPDSNMIDRIILGLPSPPELNRRIMYMLEEGGMTATEIAAHFGLTHAAVWQRVYRIRRARKAQMRRANPPLTKANHAV